ncbi:MAG: transketolase family protein [bacterium]|nr:transketolase family protein [bacterium]
MSAGWRPPGGESGLVMGASTREAYGDALVELGRERPEVVVLDADLSASTQTRKFARVFPERFFNAGIAEQNMVGMAAGLALAGKLPFASSFAVFLPGRCYDQVRLAICYQDLAVKLVATHGGITVGEDGASHQALEDLALARALPNLTVLVPADAVEARQATLAAADWPGPVYLRLGRPAVPALFEDGHRLVIGRAQTLLEGADVTLAACGIMLSRALDAAAELAAEGVSAAVMNVSTLKPLDTVALVEAARRTGALVTAEEHSVIGGLGSAVAEVLAEHYPVPVIRVGVEDRFGKSGPPGELMEHFGLTATAIARAARQALARKR